MARTQEFCPTRHTATIEAARAIGDPEAETTAWAEAVRAIRADVADRLGEPIEAGPSPGRGVLRRELEISVAACDALLRGLYLENPLERTFAALVSGDWFNQFNVTSEVTGLSGGTRSAIDLIHRFPIADQRVGLDLIEVKAWSRSDRPEDAALQLIRYACVLDALTDLVDPFVATTWWAAVGRIRLWVMGPTGWFHRYWGPTQSDGTGRSFGLLSRAIERVGPVFSRLRWVTFQPAPIRLELTAEEFTASFDPSRLRRETAGSPEELLTEVGRAALIERFETALAAAGLRNSDS
jgi:hypothetical protein